MKYVEAVLIPFLTASIVILGKNYAYYNTPFFDYPHSLFRF